MEPPARAWSGRERKDAAEGVICSIRSEEGALREGVDAMNRLRVSGVCDLPLRRGDLRGAPRAELRDDILTEAECQLPMLRKAQWILSDRQRLGVGLCRQVCKRAEG